MLRTFCLFLTACAVLLLAGCGSSANPAATVNGQAISMTSFTKQVAYKRWVTEQQDGNVDVCSAPGYQEACAQLKRTALDELIAGVLVEQYAASHHINVSEAEYTRQWQIFFKQKFHANTAVLNAYAKNLGLTAADIKNLVRQNTLGNAVMYHITATMPAAVPATHVSRVVTDGKKAMAKVQKLLKTNSFKRTVFLTEQTNGTACAAIGCGEVGWIPNALLSGPDRKVITAATGSLVGPVPAPDSRYIIFLVEGHKSNYVPAPAQQLQMREQIFAAWLLQLHQRAAIHTYVTT